MRAAGDFNLERVETLVHEALERPPGDRAAFLDTTCGGDLNLRREVESLLELEAAADSHFSTQASDWSHVPMIATGFASDPELGTTVGHYRLVERIGSGGMGNVYRAERTGGEFDQIVAVKLIRRGLDSEDIVTRFRRERRVLAGLNHPNIARLIDGGTTDAGRPYLIMEYIDGERITSFCDAQRLTIRQRVEVFGTVCDAVQYAHRNLVVHRDLKPGNILVTRGDSTDATPKLLDFGIARVLESDDPREADRTAESARRFTPAYSSPEQLRGEAVNTATDLYSLGVVLFELLVGRSPYSADRRNHDGLKAAVCDQPPLRPVVALTESVNDDDAASIARARSLDVPRLRKELSGDLEQILLTALHKEPERRYATAAAFRDDLQRWLEGLPVSARPDSVGYRLRRFVQRHRAGVAAGVLTGLALIVATVVSVAMLIEARDARAATEIENRTTAAINTFLTDMLASVDPRERGVDVTVRDVLDEAAARVDDELAEYAAVEQGVQRTIGLAYSAIGLYEQAQPHLERSLQLSEELHGANHPDLAVALSEMGVLLRAMGRYEEAEPLHRRGLAIDIDTFGENSEQAARSMNDLAQNLYDQGRYDEGRPLYFKAYEIRSTLLGEQDAGLITSLSNLARASVTAGDFAAAEDQLRETLRLLRTMYGDDHVDVIGAMNNVGFITMRRGNYEESERIYVEVVQRYREMYGDAHPDLARALNNLGECLRQKGELDKAEATHREGLAMRQKTLGDDHPLVAVSLNNLGLTLTQMDRYDEAIPIHEQSLSIRRASLGERHPDVATSLGNLGFAAYKMRDFPGAIDHTREALEIRLESFGSRHPAVANAQVNLARILIETDELAEAESLCRAALGVQQEMLNAEHPHLDATRSMLGRALLHRGQFDEAEELLLAAYEGILTRFGSGASQVQSTIEDLAALYDAWDRPDDEAIWRDRAGDSNGPARLITPVPEPQTALGILASAAHSPPRRSRR